MSNCINKSVNQTYQVVSRKTNRRVSEFYGNSYTLNKGLKKNKNEE